MAAEEFEHGGIRNFVLDLPLRALFGLLALLPHERAVDLAGWLGARILAPTLGLNRRIRNNLALVRPDLPHDEVDRMCREVSRNATRLMAETFLPLGFVERARRAPIGGEGRAALFAALEQGRPVILVSGHFGNFQVPRVALAARGFDSAGIYRPMNNAYTNRRYVACLNRIATPNHPRGMRGTKAIIGHLRKGGVIALLNDQAAYEGRKLRFMGRPALTMTSAAEFALKFNALLVPIYGIRQGNGQDFRVEVEAPIPHSDPETMTQALNDSLEAMVDAHPEQWYWIHRRWKGV